MEQSENRKLRKARKRVEALKGFYQHLLIFILVNVLIFIVRSRVLEFIQNDSPTKNFMEWVDWNILFVPLFWGIGLLFHAAKVYQFKFPFLKNWEERQLNKYMNED
ncbi:2TM domain-containing protein [Aequorivita sp. SDUM287046]|uniref:2TM domain-containing protein n=1 Tax=Aequorivita aurantiaca TaxID=3053356 RepID=A0ABT8DFH2_9FLAO|nr:2TM domain-containing protein [Aequorivita aurantiaca]MDN3724082.1 2TM domain-containing protein [Aequorivita aurantiaca]